MRQAEKKINGFTLTELLVVIFIIGILAVVVMVNFNHGKRSNDLRQAGIELQQNLRLAQNYTIGGHSLWFCDSASGDDFGNYCQTNVECNESLGTCKNGVPGGGYGLIVDSTENYTLFGDTNENNFLDSPDRQIVVNNISLKNIHIREFKLGQNSALIPSATNDVSVIFAPPEGYIHFYLETDGEAVESQETELKILVGSDYLDNTCRIITVNRISGQISEETAGCSL